MNTCDVCLLSKPSTQQCRAIRLYLWNVAPQSVPDPVNNTDAGLRQLAFHVGSSEKARRWLSRWNLDYMDRKASCIPQFVVVSSFQDDPLATSSSGSPPPYLSGDSTVGYVDRGRATAAVLIDTVSPFVDSVGTLGCCWVAPASWAVCTLYRFYVS